MTQSDYKNLLDTLLELRESVCEDGEKLYQKWESNISRRAFQISGQNLANYIIFRQHDLRGVQRDLMPLGLSSLGRCESRVLPNLDATIASLGAICGADSDHLPSHPSADTFFEGENLLRHHTEKLLGASNHDRWVRIMVTLPSDAAQNYEFFREILNRGTNCVRINCAHDGPEAWEKMVDHLRRGVAETGQPCQLLMDLGGIQARTADVIAPDPKQRRLHVGDRLLMTRDQPEPRSDLEFQTRCTIPEILDQLEVDQTVWIDDGKLGTRVEKITPDGIFLKVIKARPEKGEKLKECKGINFPDTEYYYDSLTEKDCRHLDFIAKHADLVGHSFVQEVSDIKRLQDELKQRRSPECPIGIIAKIETHAAIKNLPDLIVQAAGNQPFGVMIARGDLAVQIGYQRMAEMQEEIMWMCEAAHVPVIWATQVLEKLAKQGIPSRSEITDAAMAQRADCVMLNKGPFIPEAVSILDDVLTRMQEHQMKKTPQLRSLNSWSELASI